MVRTIDTEKPTDYVFKYMIEIEGFTPLESNILMIENPIKFDQIHYQALLYAWENDLIVLKDYGEK